MEIRAQDQGISTGIHRARHCRRVCGGHLCDTGNRFKTHRFGQRLGSVLCGIIRVRQPTWQDNRTAEYTGTDRDYRPVACYSVRRNVLLTYGGGTALEWKTVRSADMGIVDQPLTDDSENCAQVPARHRSSSLGCNDVRDVVANAVHVLLAQLHSTLFLPSLARPEPVFR